MFSLSFWEIFFIACIAIIVLKPEDVPLVAKKLGNFIRSVKSYFSDLTNMLDESDGKSKTKKLIADDGLEYEAYDVETVFDDLDHISEIEIEDDNEQNNKKSTDHKESDNQEDKKEL